MEDSKNIINIPLLGIARSGSDASCTDGKSNEIIGFEFKDSAYYPYAPTEYAKMNIEGAEKVWIHNTSLQSNWLKLEKGRLYWTKEETNEWQEIGNVGNFNKETPIDFTGNLISLGNAIYFLFKNDKYIRFTREDLKGFTLMFSTEQDKCYGIRTRYRWDALAGMEKTQGKGFAETICGLYNKLDNQAIDDNKLIGASYICYAFRLYDGTYIYASSPILLKNFDYTKQYYKEVRSGSSTKDPVYDFEKNKYATPLFGTIYGENGGNPEFSTGDLGIESGIANLPSGALSSDNLYFDGLGTDDSDFRYGSFSAGPKYDYKLNANIPLNTYREYCSYVYKNIKYDWENRKEQQSIKDVRPVDEVFSVASNLGNFNTEEMSCISCIPNTSWGTEGTYDWCDVYAFRKASSIKVKRNGSINESLRDFILSVDVFMTRPILPVETDKQETVDNFQCAEHRKIKDKKVFLDELQTSQRAFYKVMEIPFDDIISGGNSEFNDSNFLNAAIKNITAREELVSYSNHTMLYNISYNFNQKVHIADFKYELYRDSLLKYLNNNADVYKNHNDITGIVNVVIDGKSYITRTGVFTNKQFHSVLYYPDARAKTYTLYIQKGDDYYKKVFNLKASEVSDYAYYEDENGKSIIEGYEQWDIVDGSDIPSENTSVSNALNNVMRVSSIGNPIVFPYSYSYQVGNGDIIGMSSNAIALSQGQFGEHKLFVFTTDGIWAMKTDATGKTFYSDQDPVSREVCNNKNSICQIDGGVIFSSEKGLMVIAGKDASLVSKELNGKPSRVDNRVYSTAVNNKNLVLLSEIHSDADFREYLSNENASVVYLYKKNKLLIYNGTKPYCYLMDIDTKITTKLAYNFSYHISDYPNDKVVSGYSIYEFPIESNDEYVDTLIQTRPIKVNSHNFKSNYRAVVRGEFDTKEDIEVQVRSIDIDNYKADANEIYIDNPPYEGIVLNDFNEQPQEVVFQSDTQSLNVMNDDIMCFSLNSYKVGEVVNVINCDIEGRVILDENNQPSFTSIEVTDIEDKVNWVTPEINSDSYLFNNNGKLGIGFGIKRKWEYRNMEIIKPVVVIRKYSNNLFYQEVTIKGTHKDDNNEVRMSSFDESIDYNSDYYIDFELGIVDYEKYTIRSFSFYANKDMALLIPYIGADGVVRQMLYSFNVNNTIEGETSKVVGTNKIYNRLTYDYSGYIKVDDYDGNGITNGDDILTWVKLFVNNQGKECVTPLFSRYTLEKGKYYKVTGIEDKTYYYIHTSDTGEFRYNWIVSTVIEQGTLEYNPLLGESVRVVLSNNAYYKATIDNITKDFIYEGETRVYTYEEFIEYFNSYNTPLPLYSPRNLELTDGRNYRVTYKDSIDYIITYYGINNIKTETLLKNIENGMYTNLRLITNDSIIDNLIGNVVIRDFIGGYTFSFYSNYKNGQATYGQLISDFRNGMLEEISKYDLERKLNISNGTFISVDYEGQHYDIIYTGSNVITVGEFINNLNNYQTFNKNILNIKKYIGLYVFGSIDCHKWGFIGGVERKGQNLCDIIAKIERMSVKYIKLVFVGNISKDSHIDSIEVQSQVKYENKIR